MRDCTGINQIILRNSLQDKLQNYYHSLGPDRPAARTFAQLIASHIITSGNPLLWLGNWNTQAISLLKSHTLPGAESGREGPIIRAITDIFLRQASALWLQRAKDSPRARTTLVRRHYSSHDPTAPLAQPPQMRPRILLSPLGAHHRNLRIQEGRHPYLERIPLDAPSHDSNSIYCHPASLLRNDSTCLSKPTIRQLQAFGPKLSPCSCDNQCARFPTDNLFIKS
jgi:hypothetical protein